MPLGWSVFLHVDKIEPQTTSCHSGGILHTCRSEQSLTDYRLFPECSLSAWLNIHDYVPGKQVLILVIKMLTGNYESSDKTDLVVMESMDASQIFALQSRNLRVNKLY